MRILSFIGKNRDFKLWLRGQDRQKCQVVDLAEWREKKNRSKAADVNRLTPA